MDLRKPVDRKVVAHNTDPDTRIAILVLGLAALIGALIGGASTLA